MIGTSEIIGRAPRSDLHLPRHLVSQQHALVFWTGQAWMIRDLGSRNGTFVDARRISTGQSVLLRERSVVAIGEMAEAWEVASAQAPPEIAARKESTWEVVLPVDRLLTLSAGDDEAAIFFGPSGWVVEREDGTAPIGDGEFVVLGSDRWIVRINARTEGATTKTAFELSLDVVEVVIQVSRDAEFVQVAVKAGERTIDLGARAHNYLLLELVRRRLADRAEGIVDAECGWASEEDCAAVIGGAARLNVDVFRIRRLFAAMGITDGAAIIERRPRDRRMRIGIPRVSVVSH